MKFKLLLEQTIENLTPQIDTITSYPEFEETLTAIYQLDYKRTMIRFDNESDEKWKKHVYDEYTEILEKHLDLLLDFWWKVFLSWQLSHLNAYHQVLYNEYESGYNGILSPLKSAVNTLSQSLDQYGSFIVDVVGDGTSLQNVYKDISVLDDIIEHLDTFVGLNLYYDDNDELLVNSIEDSEEHYNVEGLKRTASDYNITSLQEAIHNLYGSMRELSGEYENILDGDFREAMEKYQKYTDEELQEELKNLTEMGEDTQPLQKLIAVSDELGIQISEMEDELVQIEYILYEEDFNDDGDLQDNAPLYVLSALNDEMPRWDNSDWLKNLEQLGVTHEEIFERMGEFFGYMDNIKQTLGSDTDSKIQLANLLKQKFHRTGSILEYAEEILGGDGFAQIGDTERLPGGVHTDLFQLFSTLSMDTLDEMKAKVEDADDYDYNKVEEVIMQLELIYINSSASNKQLQLLAQWHKDLKRDGISVPREASRLEMDRIKQAREVE